MKKKLKSRKVYVRFIAEKMMGNEEIIVLLSCENYYRIVVKKDMKEKKHTVKRIAL